MPITIMLADDHTLLRQGLRHILDVEPDFEVVAEAGSGLEAIQLARQYRPDVAIVDVAMKGLNGIEAAAQMLRTQPRLSVLILSMHTDRRYVIRAIKAGAQGYLLKDSVEAELLQAIRAVHAGRHFFSPAIAEIARDAERLPGKSVEDPYERLTDRERHVHQLLAEGNSNKEIAARLGLSLHTVETHRSHIMEKLGVHSMAELVLEAVRRGLVD